jgi:hypothetical protein
MTCGKAQVLRVTGLAGVSRRAPFGEEDPEGAVGNRISSSQPAAAYPAVASAAAGREVRALDTIGSTYSGAKL